MARRLFDPRQQAVDVLSQGRADVARGMGLLPVDAKITIALDRVVRPAANAG